MMSLASPQWLYGLLCVPLAALAVLVWYRRDATRRATFGEAQLVDRLRPGGHAKSAVHAMLVALALGLVCFALARPASGKEWQRAEGQGVDVCFAIDVSNSMRAPDVRFAISRLDAALTVCRQVVSELAFDRVSVVTFTDTAATLCPLTSDMGAVLAVFDGVDYETVGEGGTSLSAAVREGVQRFDERAERGRVLVVLSDGEDHEQGLEAAIAEAKERSVVIHTVGVGSTEGSPIPEGSGFLSRNKTYRGRTVISRLTEQSLKDLAERTGGTYRAARGPEVAKELVALVRDVADQGSVVKTVAAAREVYQIPLALAILTLATDMLAPPGLLVRRRRR